MTSKKTNVSLSVIYKSKQRVEIIDVFDTRQKPSKIARTK